ncbi:sine oculis-binding protein homolog [Schistocerca americana]|uniref:sine oculis-binding protein homolog n=1 Tax=Schistocerca americana TaxID=7009 RepID=UPI001F5036B8|nr:sine oculis-binding protein homolog [Schistocerca americana]
MDGALCAWCQKVSRQPVLALQPAADGGTPSHKAFCSEVCFTQCRRASFKRNRTCDWCRHVRHTVSYVDFQDGEHQLQFCSDKCLNQYKMNIFCKEAQAHLQLHPAAAGAVAGAGSSGALITPDLWLRDCRPHGASASASPTPPPSCSDADASTASPADAEATVTPPPPPPPPPPSLPPAEPVLPLVSKLRSCHKHPYLLGSLQHE